MLACSEARGRRRPREPRANEESDSEAGHRERPHAVGQWVSDRARLHPEKIAIVCGEHELSYLELDTRRADWPAGCLRAGSCRESASRSLAQNRFEQVGLLFACAKAGLIFFPMNWRLTNVELAATTGTDGSCEVVRLARAKLACRRRSDLGEWRSPRLEATYGGRGRRGASSNCPMSAPTSALAIIATSGTTGRPKGVLLTHANFFWTNLSLDLVVPITQEDVVLQVLPQFHIGGWNVQPMLAWWKGATVVLESAFEPERVLALIAEHRVTTMAGVPTTYQMIGQHPTLSTGRPIEPAFGVVGGAAMPYTLVEQWHARGVALFRATDSPKSAPNVFCLDDADALSHPCSVGRPYPYVEVALL